MTKAFFASSIVALFLVACAVEQGDLTGGPGGGANGDPGMADPNGGGGGDGHGAGSTAGEEGAGTVPGSTPPPGDLCKGEPHIGFANLDFAADRKPGEIGINRRRV